MLNPYNTDAPIYQSTFATVGTIIVSVLVLIPTLSMPDPHGHSPLSTDQLKKIQKEIARISDPNENIPGDGKVPLTSAEKIEVVQALTQLGNQAVENKKNGGGSTFYRSMTGIGLGASHAIFGVVAIVLLGAPSNDMEFIFLLPLRSIIFTASVMTIAMFSIFLQAVISVFRVLRASDLSSAMAIISEVLHLIGGVMGLAIGIVTVKNNWVDCENGDAFSV